MHGAGHSDVIVSLILWFSKEHGPQVCPLKKCVTNKTGLQKRKNMANTAYNGQTRRGNEECPKLKLNCPVALKEDLNIETLVTFETQRSTGLARIYGPPSPSPPFIFSLPTLYTLHLSISPTFLSVQHFALTDFLCSRLAGHFA